MLEKLATCDGKVVGTKQVEKALENGEALSVFVAKDADEKITLDVINLCKTKDIDIIYVETMDELGKACGIDVGAATAAILK